MKLDDLRRAAAIQAKIEMIDRITSVARCGISFYVGPVGDEPTLSDATREKITALARADFDAQRAALMEELESI